MYCTACGTKNASDNNFCKQCGQKIDRPTMVKISEEDYDRARPEEEQLSSLLERAYQLRAEGNLGGAIALCEEALQLNPDGTSAHSLLGQIYAEQGERDKAVRAYERVLQINPGSIADRVKLDELRRDASETPSIHERPRIVLTQQKIAGDPTRFGLTLVAGAVILMMTGGILALQLRPTATLPSNASPGADRKPDSFAASGQVPNGAQTNQNSGNEKQPGTGGVTQAENNPAFGASFYPILSPQNAFSAPPTRSEAPSGPIQRPQTSAVYTANNAPSLNVKEIKTPRASLASLDNANRVHLPTSPDEGVLDDGNGHYTIKVDTGNNSKPVKGTDKPVNPGAGNTITNAVIKVSGDPGTGTKEIGDPARIEAQSFISMGNEKKAKGDYNGAIQAYQKALPTAGDEAGFVYQWIAQCFQHKGAKDSAIYNYEKAITSLQKQVDSGRKVELARDSIRVCESGIKICRSE